MSSPPAIIPRSSLAPAAASGSRVPVAGPWITEHEVERVADAVRNGWYDNATAYVDAFEAGFASYVGRRFAIALPSCTSAIHLSLLALGIGPGDEVIVPESTWIASAAPATWVGATPIFADVDATTWSLSVDSFLSHVTDRTRAVVPVDLYGNMPDMYRLVAECDQRGIVIVEDAAAALGARIGDRAAGSFGATSVFSFHGTKTLTCGEGGMLVTDDAALVKRVNVLRDHGRWAGDPAFYNREVAYKYKMSTAQAALGHAQLDRVRDLVDKKRQIFRWYERRLADVVGITLNAEPAGTYNSCWMSTMILGREYEMTGEQLGQALSDRGIDTRPFFRPLSSLPAYADRNLSAINAKRNSVSYRLGRTGINLPSALLLDEHQVEYVCSQLLDVLH